MTLSDRDKKIAMVLVPLVLVGAFVFLVIKPKREEAAKAAQALETQRDRRDKAVALEQRLSLAKASFTADYTTVVRLGKAVPTSVDMPSVLVQLERAAAGTGIEFGRIAVGERIPATGGASSAGGSSSGGAASSSSAQPVAAGGAQAQSGAGQATESANNAAAGANQSTANSQAAAGGNGTPSSTSAGGGSTGAGGVDGATAVAGLDSVPLELKFTGSFFDLADFFHDLKRFVNVANQELAVRGRLMTIDSFKFGSESFPKIEAEMNARIFLSPEQQGATAGASPGGPSTGAPGSAPASSPPASSAPSPTPTAAAAPGATP